MKKPRKIHFGWKPSGRFTLGLPIHCQNLLEGFVYWNKPLERFAKPSGWFCSLVCWFNYSCTNLPEGLHRPSGRFCPECPDSLQLKLCHLGVPPTLLPLVPWHPLHIYMPPNTQTCTLEAMTLMRRREKSQCREIQARPALACPMPSNQPHLDGKPVIYLKKSVMDKNTCILGFYSAL